MEPDAHARLRDAIGRYDTEMRRLADLGIDLSLPGRQLLASLRARREDMRREHAELESTRQEADQLLLPELLDRYRRGGPADREALRELLREHRTFRWGFGWSLATRVTTAEDARNALAVLSMKDGGADYRDEIVALDHLCAAMQRAGLPVDELLVEAASWSSNIQRFPPSRSTRALLLHYAERFAG